MMPMSKNRNHLIILLSLSIIILSSGIGFYLGTQRKEREIVDLYNETFEPIKDDFETFQEIDNYDDLVEQFNLFRTNFIELKSDLPSPDSPLEN
jgi:hypothetical protein